MTKPTRADIDVLVAMLTRSAPLICHAETRRWFVPRWHHRGARADAVARLEAAGLIEPHPEWPRLRILTRTGSDVALNACTPETRERLHA